MYEHMGARGDQGIYNIYLVNQSIVSPELIKGKQKAH